MWKVKRLKIEEAEDTKADDLSPDVILTQLEKEKDALIKPTI